MATRRPAATRLERDRADAARAIRALVAALRRSARGVEQRTGITNAQLFILQQLRRADARSINELAALAHTQQSTVSLVVSRLERARLVRRARSTEDRRRVLVSLTAAGRRLAGAAPEPPPARLLRAIRSLRPAELRALLAGHRALARSMGTSLSTPPLLFEVDTTETPATRRRA
jgi:DNA-binding MarR family transcriptional regulator